MEDNEIVALFMKRDEKAITETKLKYGKYIFSISYNILRQKEDAEECVNDTYLAAWNCIPPNEPTSLAPFLGKIIRRISLNVLEKKNSAKRGMGEVFLDIDELGECIPDKYGIDDEINAEELSKLIDSFLRSLPVTERYVFIRKYWYIDSIDQICKRYGFSEGKVKMMLMRTRKKLQKHLEKEHYSI